MAEYDYLGHYTKPDYWPSDEGWKMAPDCTACRHREPDHVKKPGQSVYELVPKLVLTFHLERIVLLTHLIRSQNRGFRDGNFSLERMKKSTKGIHLVYKKNWTAAYVERLEEIYWVRSKEMEFERGEIGQFRSS